MNTSIAPETLADLLAQKGLLPAGAGPMPTRSVDRPWFISVVLGFAGWLAGIFALVFVGLLFKPDSAAGYAVAGIIMLAAAYGLYAVDRESAFFDQLALALSIAGQLAIGGAASETTDSWSLTAAAVALMQGVLLFVMPNRLAKILAAVFACLAWALAIRFAWWDRPMFGDLRHTVELLPALMGWLVIWGPVLIITHVLIATESRWMATGWRTIVRPALSGLILSLSIATWASEPFGSLQFWDTTGDAGANWLALWPLLGALASLFAVSFAFRLRNAALLGVAVVGALLHIAQFYYLLGTTLLVKSCIMLVLGVALLLVAIQLRKMVEGRDGR